MFNSIILTCEHAGNEIPEEYQFLFKGKESNLYTHKAIDFGALDLARKIAETLQLPLYYTTISRLLIEANRSEDSSDLFSEFSKNLDDNQKQEVLDRFYRKHRDQVEGIIRDRINQPSQVLHLAIHTFTPAMDGEVREGDLGVLFDPARPLEQKFFEALRHEILKCENNLVIKENFPYPGTDDGFPTFLRKKFSDSKYIGIELEVNQKYFLNSDSDLWENLRAAIASGLYNLDKRENKGF